MWEHYALVLVIFLFVWWMPRNELPLGDKWLIELNWTERRVSLQAVIALMEMGFDEKEVVDALRVNNNQQDAAVRFFLSVCGGAVNMFVGPLIIHILLHNKKIVCNF